MDEDKTLLWQGVCGINIDPHPPSDVIDVASHVVNLASGVQDPPPPAAIPDLAPARAMMIQPIQCHQQSGRQPQALCGINIDPHAPSDVVNAQSHQQSGRQAQGHLFAHAQRDPRLHSVSMMSISLSISLSISIYLSIYLSIL